MDEVIIAQIGLGRWGENLWKNFNSIPECRVKIGCDLSAARRDYFAKLTPAARFTARIEDVIKDPEIQAAVIASPAVNHFDQAKKCLEAGQDIFVEKPLALKSSQAKELARLAEKNARIVMVGHLLLYHPAFNKVKELIKEGLIGKILYLYFRRLNLGAFRPKENVLWDIGVHDLAMALDLAEEAPKTVAVQGAGFIRPEIEEVVFWSLTFPSGKRAYFQTSWLDPFRERKMVIVGTKGMLVFDEVAAKENLKFYPRSARLKETEVICLEGEPRPIDYPIGQPLLAECRHFIDRVKDRTRPRSDAHEGALVLAVLEAADASLAKSGRPVIIHHA